MAKNSTLINKERMISEFLEFVKVDSPSRSERELGGIIKKRLGGMGFELSEDEVGKKIGGNCGNIFAYISGAVPHAPILMLSAHMDCVEPCRGVKPVRKDGVIRSSGDTVLGSDDKAGLAAMFEAVRTLQEKNIQHGGIQLVITVAEESGLLGAKNMEPSRIKADIGYVLDSNGPPGKIINRAPGQNNITAIIRGKTAHAGIAPEEGINAIIVAGKAVAAIRQARIDEETTANIGIIKGGIATNIVPDTVEVISEARSRSPKKLEAQTSHMKETFERVAKENGASADVSIIHKYDPYTLAEDSRVIQLAKSAAEGAGLSPKLEATGGGSDANFFNKYGVPSAVLGIGMTKVHTKDESIAEDDICKLSEFVVSIIQLAAKMKK